MRRYSRSLFDAFVDEMKVSYENGDLWVNCNELEKEEFEDIKTALFGEGMLFDFLSIDKTTINRVRTNSWMIEGDSYSELKCLSAAEFVESQVFTFGYSESAMNQMISYRFRFYGRFSEDNPNCAVSIEILEMPKELKRLRVEVDIKCNENKKYRQLLRAQILTQKKSICGLQFFEHTELDRNASLLLEFGVKIFKMEFAEAQDQDAVQAEEEDDLQDFCQLILV